MDTGESKQIWSNSNLSEVLPGIVLPLVSSTVIKVVAEGFGTIFPLKAEEEILKDFKGRIYFNATLVEETLKKLLGLHKVSLEQILGGDQSEFGFGQSLKLPNKIRLGAFVIKELLLSFFAQMYIKVRFIFFHKHIDNYLQNIKRANTSDELNGQFRSISNFISSLVNPAFQALFYPIALHLLFLELCKKWLGAGFNEQAQNLLADGKSDIELVNAMNMLWDIRGGINNDPKFKQELLDSFNISEAVSVLQKNQVVYKNYLDFLSKFGQRCVKEMDFSLPRWNEDPTFIITLIKKYVETPDEQSPLKNKILLKQKNQIAVKQARQNLPWWKYYFLMFILAKSTKGLNLRERCKLESGHIFQVLRSFYLRLGELWVKQNILKEPANIFYFTASELNGFLQTNSLDNKNLFNIVAERKAEYQNYTKISMPDRIFGNEYNDFASSKNVDTKDQSLPIQKELKGVGISGGVVVGIARVLMSENQISEIKPGEILVTDHTDPGWTPVFGVIKGLVTNVGGRLSHASIVAREYGLPAVISVPNTTKIISTGQRITLDANTCTVTIF